MGTISRNGKSYDQADVNIAILGSLDFEVTNISYAKKQGAAANYSIGSKDPSSYSTGNNEYECSLTLRLRSVFELEKQVGGDLTRPKIFPIIVTFTDENNEIVTDVIMVKFTSQGRNIGDDEDLKYDFEMFCAGIKFNV